MFGHINVVLMKSCTVYTVPRALKSHVLDRFDHDLRSASFLLVWFSLFLEPVESRTESCDHNSRPIQQIKLMNPSRISPRVSILLAPIHSFCTAALEASIPHTRRRLRTRRKIPRQPTAPPRDVMQGRARPPCPGFPGPYTYYVGRVEGGERVPTFAWPHGRSRKRLCGSEHVTGSGSCSGYHKPPHAHHNTWRPPSFPTNNWRKRPQNSSCVSLAHIPVMSSALARYEGFLVNNVSVISSLESSLCSVTWILPRRFKDAELTLEACAYSNPRPQNFA